MRDLEAQLRAYGTLLDRPAAELGVVTAALPRRASRSLAVAIAAAAVIAIVVSVLVVARRGDGPPPHIVTPRPTVPATVAPVSVLAIGDSVMESAQGALRQSIPGIVVDAVRSRQMGQAVDVLAQYKALHVLPATVVIALGTNGQTTLTQLNAIMRAAETRRVYFVTTRVPRPWAASNNAQLLSMPARWKNAHVIDWNGYSAAHDNWFVADGFHLTTAGQYAYSSLIALSLGHPSAPAPPAPSGLDVVDVLARRALPLQPLAVAGGQVWIATEEHSSSSVFVRLEGRDPSTAKLLDSIDVPQDAVSGIAGDGEALWVVGGGDGGVPETTVSKIDIPTKSVVFTKTLTGTPCSCAIVAGDAGVWVVGNGSQHALHISEADGHVVASVALPAPVPLHAAMETRGRLLVGLQAGTVAIIDPAANRIERFVDVRLLASGDSVIVMSPASIPAIGTDPPIDGLMAAPGSGVFALFSDRWQANQFAQADFNPRALAASGTRVIVAGGDWLIIATTHAVARNEFAYEPGERRFVRIPEGPASAADGFRDAVTSGDMLWMVYDPGGGVEPSIVVTRIPESFQFR
jgi:hypothetical protein